MSLECGEDLVLIASTLAIKVSKDLDIEQIHSLIEFAGLFRHNLEIIKHKRIECEREKHDKIK